MSALFFLLLLLSPFQFLAISCPATLTVGDCTDCSADGSKCVACHIACCELAKFHIQKLSSHCLLTYQFVQLHVFAMYHGFCPLNYFINYRFRNKKLPFPCNNCLDYCYRLLCDNDISVRFLVFPFATLVAL